MALGDEFLLLPNYAHDGVRLLDQPVLPLQLLPASGER